MDDGVHRALRRRRHLRRLVHRFAQLGCIDVGIPEGFDGRIQRAQTT
jgi:hypothetical protein